MNARLVSLFLLAACLCGPARGAEEPEKKTSMKDIIKARMREEAKKAPPAPAPGSQPSTSPSSTTTPAPAKDSATTTPTPPEKVAEQPPTVLPKVEVQRRRITELDRQLAKQEQDIAREKKNTKPGEIDGAINDSKTAKTLSILGGESSEYRASIAKERVSLMEAEKDIIEAIAQAKTKAEKAELQKQLDELRTFRRELEKNRR